MHLGHGRWAALGDAMANVLSFAGYDVTREFYINDAGNQMNVFADSVSHRYLQIARLVAAGSSDFPGTRRDRHEYGQRTVPSCRKTAMQAPTSSISLSASSIPKGMPGSRPTRPSATRTSRRSPTLTVLDHVKALLHSFGLDFDVWYSERTTYAQDTDGSSRLSRALDALREGGYLYEKDGAVWFRTTDFGDDKDRVLVKADGSYTYFAPDIAYHKNKLDRGFDRCIDILGADHHGYIKRIQSVGHVFGHPGQPEVVIGQMVNLFRDGVAVRMSKRTGEMVTFEELIDEVGVDATRFLMLSRSTDQTIDFDIAQAKKQDSSNPVYYVQYAHARICSLLRKAAAASWDFRRAGARRARRCAHRARCRPLGARRRRRARAGAQASTSSRSLQQVVRATSRRSASRITRRISRARSTSSTLNATCSPTTMCSQLHACSPQTRPAACSETRSAFSA